MTGPVQAGGPTAAHDVTLTVNGEQRTISVPSSATLLDALRWTLNLTGSKECCAEGECGACTVLVSGQAVNSCLVLAVEADGMDLVTIEGLADDAGPNALQKAFVATGAIQCGFCIPGMVMAAQALLHENPEPDVTEIREGLAGNLCRCAGYERIVAAVRQAARTGEEARS